MSHIKQNNAMDIVATVLAKQQENSIAGYDFNGNELTQTDPVIMRNTLLLTIFRPCSFLILRAKKNSDLEYDEFQAKIEMLFAKGVNHNGRQYKVLGASSSLKDGKVWLATKGVIEAIHSYFGSSQEALAYLGIYTSNCHHGIWETEQEIKVVDDGYKVNGKLITGDGEGYIPRDLYEELNMDERQIQVRLHGETWIGKGTLHPYDGNEFIIPKSMIKGKGMPKDGKQYFILGIREVARELKFSSSWTLLQFFSQETIESTLPKLNEELDSLEGVLTSKEKALSFLGSVQDEERFKLESYLHADLSPTHPYITNKLKKHLKKRYRDLALGSAVNLTGYMSAISDIPDSVICCKDKPKGDYVLTRYPIRDKMSFVKVSNDPELVEGALHGSVYVNNETILQLDGDYDGDLLAIIDEPNFTGEVGSSAFLQGYEREGEGTKERKIDSLKLLPFVSSEAVSIGNKVGFITYLINAAILNGKDELIPILSKNLQLEVQSLKWSTNYDRQAISEIADELEIVETFRECKFNRKAFVSFVPEVADAYENHPLFIPYNVVKERFMSLDAGNDLLSFRYDLPIYDYDITKHQSESASVVGLYNGWISDILESYTNSENKDENKLNDALNAPISFIEKWSESKTEDRKEYACAMWSIVHRRSNGIGIGSAAFHVFEDEMLELMGKAPKTESIPNEKPNGMLKTLTAVGGYFAMDGHDNWTKLNTFRGKVKELGREVTIQVKQNPVDENGKDFFVDDLRLGSLPRDQFSMYGEIQVGNVFDAIITQKGKAVYIHTLS
jgi:hypothetical protein